jgi:putative endonuclease
MTTLTHKKMTGDAGEAHVVAYLQQQRYTILERNYTVRPYGEIDIIAAKGDVIVFVEVKARQHHYFDTSEVITVSKQRKIAVVAQLYFAKNTCDNKVGRFDVALVHQTPKGLDVTYIENAFVDS